jgi:hypothetical protein
VGGGHCAGTRSRVSVMASPSLRGKGTPWGEINDAPRWQAAALQRCVHLTAAVAAPSRTRPSTGSSQRALERVGQASDRKRCAYCTNHCLM